MFIYQCYVFVISFWSNIPMPRKLESKNVGIVRSFLHRAIDLDSIAFTSLYICIDRLQTNPRFSDAHERHGCAFLTCDTFLNFIFWCRTFEWWWYDVMRWENSHATLRSEKLLKMMSKHMYLEGLDRGRFPFLNSFIKKGIFTLFPETSLWFNICTTYWNKC